MVGDEGNLRVTALKTFIPPSRVVSSTAFSAIAVKARRIAHGAYNTHGKKPLLSVFRMLRGPITPGMLLSPLDEPGRFVSIAL